MDGNEIPYPLSETGNQLPSPVRRILRAMRLIPAKQRILLSLRRPSDGHSTVGPSKPAIGKYDRGDRIRESAASREKILRTLDEINRKVLAGRRINAYGLNSPHRDPTAIACQEPFDGSAYAVLGAVLFA
jgi:hypothetical protein